MTKNKFHMFDLHAHTLFSDGQWDLDTILKILIKLGIKYIGFADHVFPGAIYKHKQTGLTTCYSKKRLEYRKKVFEIYDKKYPQIKILNSAEIDLYPNGTLTLPKGVTPDFFDYLLIAKHHTLPKQFNFLYKNHPKLEKWMWDHNPRLKLNKYMWEKGLYAAFERYHPDIFAHPQEGLPKYLSEKVIKRFLLYCKKYNVAIELNGSVLRQKKELPDYLYKMASKMEIKFSLASDFHGFGKNIEELLNLSQYPMEIVEKYDLDLIDPEEFIRRRQKRLQNSQES
ncbi:MAG: PHP domain-containing protein [Promethearchaeota archaeon]